MDLTKKPNTIAVLEKANTLIDLMTEKADWELSELSERCRMPKPTVRRILINLEQFGYVSQKKKGGSYSLGYKFLHIGKKMVVKNPFVRQAAPYCLDLLDRLHETVNLSVRSGLSLLLAVQYASNLALRVDFSMGATYPIYASASGKAYAAFMSEEDYTIFVSDLRHSRPELTDQDMAIFSDELAIVRQQGIAFEEGKDCVYDGISGLAAPIFDCGSAIVGTIGCSFPSARLTQELAKNLTFEVPRTAAAISAQIGAPVRHFPSVHWKITEVYHR